MSNKKREFSPFMVVGLVFLSVYTVSLFAPLIWALMSSFKGNLEYIVNNLSWPKKFVNNYAQVLKYFLLYYFWSGYK